jgi:membrane protease subunit HflK
MADYEVYNPEYSQEEKKKKNFNPKKLIIILIIIGIGIYFLTGIYQVGPSEVSLVKTFGKYTYTSGPGIHYNLPLPIQSRTILDIRSVKKIEIGFDTDGFTKQTSYSSNVDESNMITGDENILSVEAVVQYRINDPVKFVFNLTSDYDLVKFTTESILRERVALSEIDDVLTAERDEIAMETAKIVQETLNEYDAGILIENVYLQDVNPPDPVVAAFNDVNNAKQDKEKSINEAQRYSNDVIPNAEGEAQKILREAESYAYEKVAIATGESEKFKSILKEYQAAENITKKRLILDSIKEMLESSKIKIISDNGGTLKLLNLDEVLGGDVK